MSAGCSRGQLLTLRPNRLSLSGVFCEEYGALAWMRLEKRYGTVEEGPPSYSTLGRDLRNPEHHDLETESMDRAGFMPKRVRVCPIRPPMAMRAYVSTGADGGTKWEGCLFRLASLRPVAVPSRPPESGGPFP